MQLGCVSRSPIVQDEWQQMVKAEHLDENDSFHSNTQRTYTDKSTEEVLEASREIFMLMDKKDMKIEETEVSISAMRDWFLWALMVSMNGYDYWNVTALPSEENSSDTLVTIAQASEKMGQMAGFGAPVGNNGITAMIGGGGFSTNAKLYTDEAAYQLFWSRLEYLLGLSDKWIGCRDARSWAQENGFKGTLRAMCEFAEDKSPEKLPELTQAD